MPKPRIPEQYKRVLLFGRVTPGSIQYLQSLGAPNLGRAIDQLVEAHKAIIRGIRPDRALDFELPAKLPLRQ